MNAKREQIRQEALLMGIDEAYINLLVETFYERVRQHDELGPVFERAIGANWSKHLQQMKLFWASVALNAGVYSGKPVPAHLKQKTIRSEHFDDWLFLFENALRDTAATKEAVDYFMVKAERIAESLKISMFGSPGLEYLLDHD